MLGAMLIAAIAGATSSSPRAVALVEQGESDTELSSFLRARVLDTWGLHLGDHVAPSRGAFRIVLVRSVPGSVEARIEEAGDLVASRELESREDPRALDAIVWLFVKSTISRAMIDAPPAPPLMSRAAPAPAARSVVEPRPEALGAWSVHAQGVAFVGDVSTLDFGVAAGAQGRLGSGIGAGIDVGYRHEVIGKELSVQHFPIDVFAEVDLSTWAGESLNLAAGFEFTVDIGRATSIYNSVAVTMPAFAAGPYAKYRVPITRGGSGELALAVEAGASFAIQPRKYLLETGEEVVDGAWAIHAATGLDWRWR